jgi:hypothetical protein
MSCVPADPRALVLCSAVLLAGCGAKAMDACEGAASRVRLAQALEARREVAAGGSGWAAAKIGPVPGPVHAHALERAQDRVAAAAWELARAKAACDVRD